VPSRAGAGTTSGIGVCSEQSVDALKRYAQLAEEEGHTSEREAATFEAEASRSEAQAEAAERRPAGSFVGFTEGKST
jgi:hypothetical protein